MTTERKDGGPDNPPAFPPNAGWRDNDPDCRGLSMRDWFAGQAIEVMVRMSGDGDGGWDPAAVAVGCYLIADALLAERQKGGA
jgi:hypothetical protein